MTRAADPVPVDLELVLAVDASASIDAREAALQRAGYIAALTDKRVLERISQGSFGRIAVAYVEWAGSQETIVDWSIIEDAASAEAFAITLRAAPFHTGTATSVSAALEYSARLFEENHIDSIRRVIDISGDGFNWAGRPRSSPRVSPSTRCRSFVLTRTAGSQTRASTNIIVIA